MENTKEGRKISFPVLLDLTSKLISDIAINVDPMFFFLPPIYIVLILHWMVWH